MVRRASWFHPTPPGSPWVRSTRSTASRPRTPPRWFSTTCGSRVAACWAARTSWTRSWPRPARRSAIRRSPRASSRRWRPSRPHGLQWPRWRSASRAAYEYSLQYAQERTAFGKPIIMNQAIAFMLADMATRIDASRLLTHRAAWMSRNGSFENAEGSMSKLHAGRTAVWVTERAIQILGGYGYTREYPVERWHRDAKIMDIFEGTEQIQQLVISRAISGLRIE
ncbi:MAG: acyl-CoA dehydrogenase family protein [Microthrixaceae bacterium]|nr:acyl-CoA dehydrogenase family protein [Microthrixaceae bacterium]